MCTDIQTKFSLFSCHAGNNRQALHKQLCEAIHQMEVGEVLALVRDEYCEDFYKYYLHDFVRTIHKSQNSETEQVGAEYSVSLTCDCRRSIIKFLWLCYSSSKQLLMRWFITRNSVQWTAMTL